MPSASFLARMQAAAQRGPELSSTRKRANPDTAFDSDDRDLGDENLPPMSSLSTALGINGPATRNATVAVKTFAKKQKLRGEQHTQLDTFLNVNLFYNPCATTYTLQDVPTVREGKLFALLLSLQNDVGNILVAAPPFAVSSDLKVRRATLFILSFFSISCQTNIQSYAMAVLLSPKLAQYRGEISTQHVMVRDIPSVAVTF